MTITLRFGFLGQKVIEYQSASPMNSKRQFCRLGLVLKFRAVSSPSIQCKLNIFKEISQKKKKEEEEGRQNKNKTQKQSIRTSYQAPF